MLSIKVIKAGSEAYYLDLAREDYYFNGGEPPGQWMGSGCRFFNLFGTVERQAFSRLFNGFHPNANTQTATASNATDPAPPPVAKSLVQNAGAKDRRAGFDLTFNAPKSVSVIWSQSKPEMQKRIEELHNQAIQDTLTFIEQTLAYSRTGHAGSGDLVPVKVIAANFRHGTSRAQDAHLHSHLVVMNVAVDATDLVKTRSIEPKPIFKNKMLLGAIYRSHLAHALHKEFGFNAIRKGDSFEIQGVPDEVIQAHSKRRKQVLARLKELGRSGGAAAAQAAVETRPEKQHIPHKDLVEAWRKENESLGFDDRTLEALICVTDADRTRYIPKLIKDAFDAIQRRSTHFTAHDFMREVLYVAPIYGVSPDDLHQPIQDFLRDSPEVVPIATLDGSQRFVAASVLEQELNMLSTLRKLHDRQGVRVSDKTLANVIDKNSHRDGDQRPTLNDEQLAAVRHITQNEQAIRIVQGYAGTGKTTMLRTAVQAWQADGYSVVGACFTGAAADKLQEEIGVPCDTIHMTLADFQGDAFDTLRRWGKHSIKQLGRAALKKKTYRYEKKKRPHIDGKTIILLDEAGMINTRHMLMLMEWVEQHNATLVLTGDAAQLPAIEGGSPFMSVSKRVGFAEMKDIRRQEEPWARAAALHLAKGEVAEALALYDKRNLVKVSDDLDDALERLVKDWADHVWDHPEDARILTLTNDQAHKANHLAQEELIKRRVLDGSSYHAIEDVDEESGRRYTSHAHVGDRVLFTKNDRKYKVRNGHTGTILKFIRMGKSLRPGFRVKLDNDRVVDVPLSFSNLRLGYASTVHKAQGATYDEVFVLLGGAAQNQPLSYVQGTRSSKATHFYTEKALYDLCQDIDESLLVSQMEQEVELSLAADLFVPPTASATNRDDLIAKLLDDWKARSTTTNHSSLVITKDDADAKRINHECNRIRYAMAQTAWDEQQVKLQQATQQQQAAMPMLLHEGRTIVVGDRLRFMQGTMATGLIKGDLATVTGIVGERIDFQLDRGGKSVSLATDMLPQFDFGYAMKFEQAMKLQHQPQDAYLLEPDKFRRAEMQPAYSTATDYFKWQPTPLEPTSLYSPTVAYANSSYQPLTQPQQVWTYMSPQQTQMAAAAHDQAYRANQQACWQAHQFQHTTQISREHSHAWQHGI